MKIPNISRLYGGVGTKLKARLRKILLVIALLAAVLCVSQGLFYVFDVVWNGVFVDWFEENYMMARESTYNDGTTIVTYSPDWRAVKSTLLSLLSMTAVLWMGSILLVSHFYARVKVKNAVTETSRMIHSYMNGEKDSSEIFSKEYTQIASQMTEIKSTIERHEQLLREEAARKSDLITYLAHDLKTPLTSVIGYLSLLDEAPDMPKEQRKKYVGITLDKANRLEKLINEFFEITRYNLQQIVLERETVDLYYMLMQMTDEFYPVLQAHGNQIRLTADENLSVYADPERLARVFNNILKNAIAYSYPGSEIQILAESTDREICISFINRGKTIPKQKLDSIFEKFFRLDEARTTNTGGAGLGLAIAREIVTLHGGTIIAESEKECTTFRVSLPA